MLKQAMMTAALLVGTTAAVATPATAQNRNVLNQQGGLVNVNVTNVDILKNFANNLELEVLNNANISVPIVVQAPINIAAQVCGVAVNVLARGGPAGATCDAMQGSEALTDLAVQQLTRR